LHDRAGSSTVELLRQSLGFLVRDLTYDVPPQDLTIDTRRLPALPRSRFALANVRAR
jgi:fatty-acid peroxygenase